MTVAGELTELVADVDRFEKPAYGASVDVTDARSKMQLAVSVGAIEVRNATVGLVRTGCIPQDR